MNVSEKVLKMLQERATIIFDSKAPDMIRYRQLSDDILAELTADAKLQGLIKYN